ncbi:Phytanoyl-CoA dioxygenase [Plasmopara halstedii]|uniref:Phytanoyl-CoA dioxygenase n=1 Tax=Plasmopara halstedii TaxID=4781 RepID=A0A0P1AH32_PLAHL|nr:Phytanoyl-CoA dioxygenase [Plasmopara halstedii]CEG40256.1 Phytanoyl-CoA dioxygenase [Plasmopara halstedii]|eukprot:XP_024576625.1 Phytanoyl-CoA dioxygenase [Plasmopara halstedii]
MSTECSRRLPPSPPSTSTSCQYNDFAVHGWACIPNFLSPSELRVLQSDCSVLYARESDESITAKGCVLDVMSNYPMHDLDPSRIELDCYLRARADQLNSNDAELKTFASLLFEKLPTVAGQMLATTFEKDEPESAMFFFNEHFVVKPPRSHVEFRWHRDDDEQLAMCVHRKDISPYISAWCALDDVTEANGALQFVSLNALGERMNENVETLECHASEPVIVKAGDVIFFLSNVWHSSSSNESNGARRAFYAQYSQEKITARPRDSAPLCHAIPCSGSSSTISGNLRMKKIRKC